MVEEYIWELDHLNHAPIAWVKELVQVQKGVHLSAFPAQRMSNKDTDFLTIHRSKGLHCLDYTV